MKAEMLGFHPVLVTSWPKRGIQCILAKSASMLMSCRQWATFRSNPYRMTTDLRFQPILDKNKRASTSY